MDVLPMAKKNLDTFLHLLKKTGVKIAVYTQSQDGKKSLQDLGIAIYFDYVLVEHPSHIYNSDIAETERLSKNGRTLPFHSDGEVTTQLNHHKLELVDKVMKHFEINAKNVIVVDSCDKFVKLGFLTGFPTMYYFKPGMTDSIKVIVDYVHEQNQNV